MTTLTPYLPVQIGFHSIYLESIDQEYWMGLKYIKNKLPCPNMQKSSIMEKMLFAAHIRVGKPISLSEKMRSSTEQRSLKPSHKQYPIIQWFLLTSICCPQHDRNHTLMKLFRRKSSPRWKYWLITPITSSWSRVSFEFFQQNMYWWNGWDTGNVHKSQSINWRQTLVQYISIYFGNAWHITILRERQKNLADQQFLQFI